MAYKGNEQVIAAIKRSTSPLICIASGTGADGYAAALGLAEVMRGLGKKPTVVASDGLTPSALSFLPGAADVKDALERMRRFKIEIDVSKTPVDGLSYELKDGKMIIHLEPRRGSWKKEDVKMAASSFRHDLIILLGAADLQACGKLYADQPEFFAKTPIVNVDYRAENEHFGNMNAVDVTACSLGEVCHGIAESADPSLVDARVATAFLTGIIAQTKGFRSRSVGPKHLESAGKLLAKGANRDLIVERLYRTRSVGTLRLWGRVLAHLKHDLGTKLVWATLTRSDFAQAGADDAELADVVDELIASAPEAQVVALLFEARDGSVCAMIRAERPRNAAALAATWNGTGTPDDARICFEGKTITEVETVLIEGLKKSLT